MKSRLAIATAVCLFGFDPGSGLKAQGSGDPLSTWHDRTPAERRISFQRVVFAGDRFIAIGQKRTNFNEVWTSPDGVKWSGYSTGTTNREFTSVAFGNHTFVVQGSCMVANTPKEVIFETAIATSTNGTSWSPLPLTADSFPLSNGAVLGGVVFGNGRFVMMGRERASGNVVKLVLWSSTDGRNWKAHRPDFTWPFLDLHFLQDRFLGVDPPSGDVLLIENLDEWVQTKTRGAGVWPTGITAGLSDVAHGNNLFVAVGDTWISSRQRVPAVATSPDARIWNLIKLPAVAGNLNGVAYGGNTFVAIDSFTRLLVSRDGSTWESRSAGTNKFFRSVIYGKGTFMLIGNGRIWQSNPLSK